MTHETSILTSVSSLGFTDNKMWYQSGSKEMEPLVFMYTMYTPDQETVGKSMPAE